MMALILALVLVLVTAAVHEAAAGNAAAIAGQKFWQQKLAGVPMPSTVAARLSPLQAERGAAYANMVGKGSMTAARAAGLCKEADLYCKSDIDYSGSLLYGCIQCITTETVVDPHLFLPNQELRPGGRFTMPNLYDPQPMKAFLPPSLAQPFMSAFSPASTGAKEQDALPQSFLQAFNVRPGSNMARTMASVLATCRSAEKHHVDDRLACVSTVESMASFVASVLLSEEQPTTAAGLLRVVAESSTVASQHEVQVVNVQEEKLAMAPVTCHSWVFPFAVYYCHYVKDVRVLRMDMRAVSSNGQEVAFERTVLCHRWKELLRPKFEALGIPPGQEACHFIYGSNLMFLKPAK